MKATNIPKPAPIPDRELVCVVYNKRTISPYGLLRNDKCVCTKACYTKHMEVRHAKALQQAP